MHKFFGKVLIVLLVIGAVFLLFGRVETYNNEKTNVIEAEYMGNATIAMVGDDLRLLGDALPEDGLLLQKESSLLDYWQEGSDGVVLMDFEEMICYYEKRTLLTGKLVESSETIFYQITDVMMVEEEQYNGTTESTFDHALIVFE